MKLLLLIYYYKGIKLDALYFRHQIYNLLITNEFVDCQVEQLLQGQEDSQGNVNYEEFVRMVMSG